MSHNVIWLAMTPCHDTWQYRLYEVNTQQNSFIIMRTNIKQQACRHLNSCNTSKRAQLTLRTGPGYFIEASILISVIICESNLITLVIESWKTIRILLTLVSKYNLVKVVNQMYCGRDHFFYYLSVALEAHYVWLCLTPDTCSPAVITSCDCFLFTPWCDHGIMPSCPHVSNTSSSSDPWHITVT